MRHLDADTRGRLFQTRGPRTLVLAMVAAAMVIAGSSPVASAKPGYVVHPGGVDIIIPLGKRAGYTASISANDAGRVQLSLERAGSYLQYSTTGRVSSQRIEASFGALGNADIRLQLANLPEGSSGRSRCKGRPPVFKRASYRGSIRFPAQADDIPGVVARRGGAYFERRFRRVCKRRSPRPTPNPFAQLKRRTEEGALTVRGQGEGRTVQIDALIFALKRNPASSGGIVSAVAYERQGRVRISRRTGASLDTTPSS